MSHQMNKKGHQGPILIGPFVSALATKEAGIKEDPSYHKILYHI
jgi:hypothetical protein